MSTMYIDRYVDTSHDDYILLIQAITYFGSTNFILYVLRCCSSSLYTPFYVMSKRIILSGARNGEAQMALLCNEAHEFNCKKTLTKFKIDSANRISTDAIAARVRVFPVL